MCLAAVEEGATPGLVVLVAARGQTLFHEAFGARQLVPRRLPALPDTMYDVASLTKAVATTVFAMQEIGNGRLTLDTKVATLLSEFSAQTGADARQDEESGPKHDSEDGASEHGVSQLARDDITVRQLLSHSSGLPAHRPFWKQAAHSPAERLAIERLAAREPLVYPPGTRAVYSDLGFILLGWLLERLTGARLDRLFQERIARPLGLAATTFVNLADSEARARLLGDRTVAATQICRRAPRPRPRRGRRSERLRHGWDRGPCGALQHRRRPRRDRHRARRLLPRPRPSAMTAWSRATSSGSSGHRRASRGRPGGSGGTARRSRARRPARGFRAPRSGTSPSPDARSGSIPCDEIVIVLLSNRVHPTVPTDDRFRRFRPALHDAALSALGL